MFGGFDNGWPPVDRGWIVHRDDKERCLGDRRSGLNRSRNVVRDHRLFSLDEGISEPTEVKGKRTYLGGRSIYRFSVVDRNDRSGRDDGHRGGDFFIDRGRGLLLVNNGGFLLGLRGNLDATLFSRLRSGGRDLFLLHGNGSGDGGYLGFFRSGWFVTGRIISRFRRGIIDIVHISSPIDFGWSLVDGGPPAVDDEFVQDPFFPGDANGGDEAGRTLIQTNGTGPLLEKKKKKHEKCSERAGPGANFESAYLIKGSGDDNLVGVVRPGEGREKLTGG